MNDSITVPRKQVLICALCDDNMEISKGEKIYRINSRHALERMLNGYNTYELTTQTIHFTGSVDVSEMEISHRLDKKT